MGVQVLSSPAQSHARDEKMLRRDGDEATERALSKEADGAQSGKTLCTGACVGGRDTSSQVLKPSVFLFFSW